MHSALAAINGELDSALHTAREFRLSLEARNGLRDMILSGLTDRALLKADSGHELVTFTTSSGICANDAGKRFNVRGTIKEHSSYQGRSQTNLSRCVFKPVE